MTGLLVNTNVTAAELFAVFAVTLNVPVVPFAVTVTDAIPLAFVIAVTSSGPPAVPDVNVTLAPLEGRVNVRLHLRLDHIHSE